MRGVAAIGWAGLAALCAVGFAVVTGIFNPNEKVNGLWLVVASACRYRRPDAADPSNGPPR